MNNIAIDFDEIERVILKKSLYAFHKEFWSTYDSAPYEDNWLTEYLCECFMYSVREFLPAFITNDWINDEDFKVLVDKHDGVSAVRTHMYNNHNWNMPPRHSKSSVLNVSGPAWVMIVVALVTATVSHSATLAEKMNARRQKIFNSDRFKNLFPDIIVTKNSRGEVNLSNGSISYTVTMERFTGDGADVIVNDDLVTTEQGRKDMETMAAAKAYFRNTLPTRRNQSDDSVVWNIQQRVAPGDITGMILDTPKLANRWSQTTIQAISDKDYTIIFPCSGQVKTIKKGDHLWPERFGDYQGQLDMVGFGPFETQFQQNAINSDLTVIKPHMFNYIERNSPEHRDFMQSSTLTFASHDFPVKENEKSDFTGSVLAYKAKNKLLVMDAKEKRMSYPKQKKYVQDTYAAINGVIQIIEDKAGGAIVLQDLADEVSNLEAFNPGTHDKRQRLEVASEQFEHHVYFICEGYDKDNKPILNAKMKHLRTRLLNFPFVDHDDLVDGMSQLILFVFGDTKYQVYYRSFNDDLVIEPYDITRKRKDYAITKDGKSWKILEVVIEKNDDFIATNEWEFYGSRIQVIDHIRPLLRKATRIYDATYNREVYQTLMNKMYIQPISYDLDKTITTLRVGFSTGHVKIFNTNKKTIADIELTKYSKVSYDKGELKLAKPDLNFAGCLRVILKANKGNVGTFL